MPFVSQTFEQYVANWLTVWAADMEVEPNLPLGDPALATAEADASQAVALQFIAEQVVEFARATTSTGVDLDSWMAQFAFPRLPAVFATGVCLFSALAPLAQAAFVPVGTIVQAPGGGIQYQVIADNSQPNYNSAQNAYILPSGETSMNVAVQSVNAGSGSNVQAATLTQIASTLFGIPIVTNTGPIQDGQNAESDEAFRARFVEYLNSLSKATEVAILEALQAIQAGLKISLFENVLAIGNPPTGFVDPYYGNIVAIIDDGSGNPSANLKQAANNAVNTTRAFGIQYQVLPPAVVVPSIELNIKVDPAFTNTVVETAVQTAIIAMINSLAIGGVIYLSQIELAAMLVPGVVAVQPASLKINGSEQDLDLSSWQEALVQAINIAVGTY